MKQITLHLRDGGIIEVAPSDIQCIEAVKHGAAITVGCGGEGKTYHVYEVPSRIEAMLAQ